MVLGGVRGCGAGGRGAVSQHFPMAFVFTRLNVSSLKFELFLFCPSLRGERKAHVREWSLAHQSRLSVTLPCVSPTRL